MLAAVLSIQRCRERRSFNAAFIGAADDRSIRKATTWVKSLVLRRSRL
jgi:hypothetical protein